MQRFRTLLQWFCGGALALAISACSYPVSRDDKASLEYLLGQKLMLDLRYFCHQHDTEQVCRQPLLKLPDALAEVLRRGQIGGVILFADNIQDTRQTMTLIDDMQQVMREAGLPPLLIAVDQEGGRVARLPEDMLVRFGGNMALGASAAVKGTTLATQVAELQAQRLKQLGFNVNFAPTVDVNINPQNPVINVRSYGESPQQVARLGQATVAALQQQGVASALKHFPGHGDTLVDSHIGLPRVDHDRATIDAVDLLPFQQIIASASAPALLMTAHIQYPQLDSSTFVTDDGRQIIVPATMSRTIITDLLRGDLGYQGVVISDALDMAGVAQYYSPLQATLATFAAGVDIALMPFKLRNDDDIEEFWRFQQQLVTALSQQPRAELEQSLARINALKQRFLADVDHSHSLQTRIEAFETRGRAFELALQDHLASAATTLIYDTGVLPLTQPHWHWLMPDALRCQAALHALAAEQSEYSADCISLAHLPSLPEESYWRDDAVIIVGDITPAHSLAELGGMDDIHTARPRATAAARQAWLQQALADRSQVVVYATLRSPYSAADFTDYADAATASFDYSAFQDDQAGVTSPAIRALVQALLNNDWPGTLPVTVSLPAELLKQ
jgi:beta-N-acetylhexosaminidase